MELPNAVADNTHFLVRNRNLRNELLRQTDFYMLPDVYEPLTEQQKEEITTYRQVLRDFISSNKDIYLSGKAFIDFPPAPSFTNLKLPKY